MKKLLAIGMILSQTAAFANTSAELNLKGNIAQKLSVDVAAESIAQTLDLTASATDLKVATLGVKSNSTSGYKILVTSTYNGNLTHADGDAIAYNLSVAGNAIDLNAGSAQISDTNNAVVDIKKDVKVSYTGVNPEEYRAGDYVDTVTFAISAN